MKVWSPKTEMTSDCSFHGGLCFMFHFWMFLLLISRCQYLEIWLHFSHKHKEWKSYLQQENFPAGLRNINDFWVCFFGEKRVGPIFIGQGWQPGSASVVLIFICFCLVAESYPTLLQPHGLLPTWLLYPWDFTGKNTGVGSHSLLQGILLTHGSNPHLMHWQADSLPLSHQGSPHIY